MRVILHEGAAGRFDIEYGTVAGSASFSASVGFESKNAVGYQLRPCGTGCSQSDLSALSGRRFTFTQDPGIELVAVGLIPPQFIFEGAETPISVQVQSLHGSPIGPYEVAVEAATDAAFTSPVEVGRSTSSSSPFQLSELVVPIRAGAQDGLSAGTRVYLRAVVDADGVIAEVNEGNNRFTAASPVLLLQGKPDVRVDAVRASRYRVAAGDSVDLHIQISNAGSYATGPISLAGMLSSNPVITANDGELGRITVDLAPGASVTATVGVTIPGEINSGSYFLGGLADVEAAVDELNESNNGLATYRAISVTGGPVSVRTSRLPTAELGETYGAFLVAAGGSGSYTWAVQGSLPSGLDVAPQIGQIFGRPTSPGCETFTVVATDVADPSRSASAPVELCVVEVDEPLTVVTRTLPTVVVGQEYAFELVATGEEPGADLEWVAATPMPEGFRLTPEGRVVGVGAEPGSFPFTAQVSDGIDTANRELELLVQANANLQIVPEPLPTGQVGMTYSHQLSSTGGIAPIVWLSPGSALLDLGLDLTPDGLLSGVPRSSGSYLVVIEARDAGPAGQADRDQNTFELLIESDGGLSITTGPLPMGNVGQAYQRAIAAVGGVPPYSWRIESGRLPPGLSSAPNSTTNELWLTGLPEEEGVRSVLISATDEEGRVAMKAFTVEIGPEVAPPDPEDTDGCTHTRTGGPPPPGSDWPSGWAWRSGYAAEADPEPRTTVPDGGIKTVPSDSKRGSRGRFGGA